MLVKKINSEWKPSEKPELQVGETIEVTNPKELILKGEAEAVDGNGLVISAYELYGVINGSEKSEYEEYLQWKKLKQQKELAYKLGQENAELKKQLVEEADKESDIVENTRGAVDPEGVLPKKELTTAEKRAAALEKARAARKK